MFECVQKSQLAIHVQIIHTTSVWTGPRVRAGFTHGYSSKAAAGSAEHDFGLLRLR